MIDIYTLTEDNISEVAKLSGRHESDLKCMLQQGQEKGKTINIIVDKPDIPEGFGRR
jgi:hypothetical protein